MGEFNSDNHLIYCYGQESLRRNGVALIVNQRVQKVVFGWISKNDCSFPRQTTQYHSIPNLCPKNECQRRWNWTVLWRPTKPSRTDSQKRCPFHHRGLGCKNRTSRDTWSYKQVWPWSTKWSRAKANRVLPKNTLVIANTLFQQHKRGLYTWTSPDGQYQNQIIFFAAKDEKGLYSQKKQDWELTVAQIINPLLPNLDLNWRK